MKQIRNVSQNGPHPVDIHVGRKIRLARIRKGLNQMRLAEGLGLSFQQVQKYEAGHNRISASHLFETGELLGVSPAYFFEGLEAGAKNLCSDDQEMAVQSQTQRLMKYAERLNPEVLASVTRLVKSMVEDVVDVKDTQDPIERSTEPRG